MLLLPGALGAPEDAAGTGGRPPQLHIAVGDEEVADMAGVGKGKRASVIHAGSQPSALGHGAPSRAALGAASSMHQHSVQHDARYNAQQHSMQRQGSMRRLLSAVWRSRSAMLRVSGKEEEDGQKRMRLFQVWLIL